MDVQQVGNDFGEFGVRERGADEARIAVMQRRHRVEQMREATCAMLECGDGVVVGTERMAELHAHAARCHLGDDLHVAGDFRRQRDHANRRDRQILQHFVHHRRYSRVRLRAELAGVDVRTFQMDAEHTRAAWCANARVVAQPRDDAHQFVARRGHRGSEQTGRAITRMRAGDGFDRVAAFHHVGAAAAVHVQIDETGQDVRRVVLRRIDALACQRRDTAVFVFERAVNPPIGGEYVSGQHESLW